MLSSCVVAASSRHAAPVATTRPAQQHGMTRLRPCCMHRARHENMQRHVKAYTGYKDYDRVTTSRLRAQPVSCLYQTAQVPR